MEDDRDQWIRAIKNVIQASKEQSQELKPLSDMPDFLEQLVPENIEVTDELMAKYEKLLQDQRMMQQRLFQAFGQHQNFLQQQLSRSSLGPSPRASILGSYQQPVDLAGVAGSAYPTHSPPISRQGSQRTENSDPSTPTSVSGSFPFGRGSTVATPPMAALVQASVALNLPPRAILANPNEAMQRLEAEMANARNYQRQLLLAQQALVTIAGANVVQPDPADAHPSTTLLQPFVPMPESTGIPRRASGLFGKNVVTGRSPSPAIARQQAGGDAFDLPAISAGTPLGFSLDAALAGTGNMTGVSSIDYPGNFPFSSEDMSWSFERFKEHFQVVVSRVGKDEMEFDLIGIDASLANAFRRILIAEANGDDQPSDLNTIVFKLQVKCEANPNAHVGSMDPEDLYINSTGPVYGDIVLGKMRPGQSIHAEMHCQKGIGKEHAKWSPVATASYRLLPEIVLLEPIIGSHAEKFQKCFPKGVVEVFTNKKGEKEAKVVNPRKDTVSREVLRHKEFEGKVRLSRVRDHFLFSIESTGALPPPVLFVEALDVLIGKYDISAVVLDVGSNSSRAGYAGEDSPRIVFPTAVGRVQSAHEGGEEAGSSTTASDTTATFVGDNNIYHWRKNMEIQSPLKNG
ncbi:DNA-directed RNA polymerases I and III subunit RPAC1, partial [Cladochytrium tenue]